MATKEKVTRIIDGDTFRTDRKQRVRLAGVDAPELNRRGGKAAKEALEKLIKGKDVSVETLAHDPYGRRVAKVRVGRRLVNNAMNKQLG